MSTSSVAFNPDGSVDVPAEVEGTMRVVRLPVQCAYQTLQVLLEHQVELEAAMAKLSRTRGEDVTMGWIRTPEEKLQRKR